MKLLFDLFQCLVLLELLQVGSWCSSSVTVLRLLELGRASSPVSSFCRQGNQLREDTWSGSPGKMVKNDGAEVNTRLSLPFVRLQKPLSLGGGTLFYSDPCSVSNEMFRKIRVKIHVYAFRLLTPNLDPYKLNEKLALYNTSFLNHISYRYCLGCGIFETGTIKGILFSPPYQYMY